MPVVNERTPLNKYLANEARHNLATQRQQWADYGQDIPDIYAGMTDDQVASQILAGRTPEQYRDQLYAQQGDIYVDNRPQTVSQGPDGQWYFGTKNYDSASDPSNMAGMLMAVIATGGMAGLAAAGAAAGGAAAGGSGLVDGLGAAAAGYGGAGAGSFIGSGLVDGLGAAAEGYGGAAAGAGGGTLGGSMDLGDYWDFGNLGDSPINYNDFVGDIPNVGANGGTSIYGSNPSVSDLYAQYQLSGQSPMDFLKNLSGLPNTPPGAQSLIQKALSGLSGNGGSGLDMTKLLGQLAATGLGIYGANRQAGQIGTLAQQYAGYGAPYRAMLANSYADPAGFLANSPDIQASVKQGTDAMARSLSTSGNPTGSGAALQQLQNYATQGLYGQLGNQRNQLANFGGLSNFNAAAPGLAGQQITAQGGALNALGSGISSVTNPPTTLEQALNAMNSNNFKLNNGTGLA